MKQSLVSVIIPVYNTKNYIRRCLDSVLYQDYREIEVILVDDGSTDGSSDLCDEYAAKDARIKVIHQENRGSGAARNAGLNLMTGRYLMFVDSDDMIANGMIYAMVKQIEKEGIILAAANIEFVDEDDNIVRETADAVSFSVLDRITFLHKMLQSIQPILVNNKIYDARIVMQKKIRFQVECRYWEDFDFNIDYLDNVNEDVASIDNKLYFVRRRRDSQTRKIDIYRDYELICSVQYVYNLVMSKKCKNADTEFEAGAFYAKILIRYYFRGGLFPNQDEEQTRKSIKNIIDSLQCVWTLKRRILYWILKHCPFLRKSIGTFLSTYE